MNEAIWYPGQAKPAYPPFEEPWKNLLGLEVAGLRYVL